MYYEQRTINLATDGTGVGSAFSPVVNGIIRHIIYTADGSVPFTGGTIGVTAETSGLPILSIGGGSGTATYQPATNTNKASDGSAMLYAAGGTNIPAPICVANERVKFNLPATGGANKKGAFILIIEGSFGSP